MYVLSFPSVMKQKTAAHRERPAQSSSERRDRGRQRRTSTRRKQMKLANKKFTSSHVSDCRRKSISHLSFLALSHDFSHFVKQVITSLASRTNIRRPRCNYFFSLARSLARSFSLSVALTRSFARSLSEGFGISLVTKFYMLYHVSGPTVD